MPYAWPKDTDFTPWELDVLDRACAVCGRGMYICDHRYRRFHTLEGPVELVCKLNHCPDPACPGHAHTKSPEDPAALRRQYQAVEEIILSIDGLQPEKGHETLYVVRELTQKRVWFAEPLLSATASEVRRLIAKAKEWALTLGKPVALWLSDRQDAFVTGIAAEFPDVPHRYCANHFLRDVAKPVLEADSHAKVRMRKKVRGLRKIEQAVLKHPSAAAANGPLEDDAKATFTATVGASTGLSEVVGVDSASAVVLDYCTTVRGILNDDQGGPLQPPGLRMAHALHEVRASLQRNLDEKKGGLPSSNSAGWRTASTAAWRPCARNKRRSETTSRTSRR